MKQKNLDKEKQFVSWPPSKSILSQYTADEVRLRSFEGSSLVIIDGYVHDVSKFLKEHPGGESFLKPHIGKDASTYFNGNPYLHSNAARNVLDMLRVGYVIEETKEKNE